MGRPKHEVSLDASPPGLAFSAIRDGFQDIM